MRWISWIDQASIDESVDYLRRQLHTGVGAFGSSKGYPAFVGLQECAFVQGTSVELSWGLSSTAQRITRIDNFKMQSACYDRDGLVLIAFKTVGFSEDRGLTAVVADNSGMFDWRQLRAL